MTARFLRMLMLFNGLSILNSVLIESFHDTTNVTFSHSALDNGEVNFDSAASVAVANADLWLQAIVRGGKLLQGIHADDTTAASLYGLGTSAASPFDGTLEETLSLWGYADNTPSMQRTVDKECNFASASGHMLTAAFAALGIQTASKGQGGPSECFHIAHCDSDAVKRDPVTGKLPDKVEQRYEVCGKEYRVTNAEHIIGVNAESGLVFAMQLDATAKAARRSWKRKPEENDLPAIRSVSDIAWAFWNRAARTNDELRNIRYMLVTMIINKESNQHINRALGNADIELQGWPGVEFSTDTDAGKALLGSPVGRWAGYFLIQHKKQLGGDKWISKVRVFKSEKEGSWPYLLFYVEGPKQDEQDTEIGESSLRTRIKAHSNSYRARNLVREHLLYA